MKNKFLVDTNILIYHTKGIDLCTEVIKELILTNSLYISVITKIEFLGWEKHTKRGLTLCEQILDNSIIYPLDSLVSDYTIQLKQRTSMKLGDAIIAATALCYELSLITRNSKDFDEITDLTVFNPFTDTINF